MRQGNRESLARIGNQRSRAKSFLGSDVEGLASSKWNAVGVTRDGGFAELVRVPAKNCYRFEHVSFRDAAFCEPLACVVFGQDRAKIDIGSEVLILGAGPIRQLHPQCCRANGASAVTLGGKDVPARSRAAIVVKPAPLWRGAEGRRALPQDETPTT